MSPLPELACIRLGLQVALCALAPSAASAVAEVLEPLASSTGSYPLLERVEALAGSRPTPELRVLVAEIEVFEARGPAVILDSLEEALRPGSETPELAREALLTSLERLRHRALVDELDRRLGAESIGRRTRSTALTVLGRVGETADVATAIAALGEDASPELAREFSQAVATILTRSDDPLSQLATVITGCSPSVATPLVQAVGQSGRAQGMQLLGSLLGQSRDLDAQILTQLGVLGARQPDAVEPSMAEDVRAFLWSTDPGLVRTSLVTVAQMQDEEAVPDLIDLLEDDEPGVRSSAHWALREITGLGITSEPERWRTWFTAEQAWFAERGMDLRAHLGRASSKQVVAAVAELAQHRWRRHETAAEIHPLLQTDDPALRKLACSVLGQLGSRRSITPLRGALEDPNPGVRKAAQAALASIE